MLQQEVANSFQPFSDMPEVSKSLVDNFVLFQQTVEFIDNKEISADVGLNRLAGTLIGLQNDDENLSIKNYITSLPKRDEIAFLYSGGDLIVPKDQLNQDREVIIPTINWLAMAVFHPEFGLTAINQPVITLKDMRNYIDRLRREDKVSGLEGLLEKVNEEGLDPIITYDGSMGKIKKGIDRCVSVFLDLTGRDFAIEKTELYFFGLSFLAEAHYRHKDNVSEEIAKGFGQALAKRLKSERQYPLKYKACIGRTSILSWKEEKPVLKLIYFPSPPGELVNDVKTWIEH